VLFHPRIDGGIALDSAVKSQQFRSHRRSTFCFQIYGHAAPLHEKRKGYVLNNTPGVVLESTWTNSRQLGHLPILRPNIGTYRGSRDDSFGLHSQASFDTGSADAV
jgi:hypothetical protein